MRELTLSLVEPKSPEWDSLVAINIRYFSECWADVSSASESGLRPFEAELLRRHGEGGRGFLLLRRRNEVIGFANVFLRGELGSILLNVAEFYIVSEVRKQGFGARLWAGVLQWGRLNGATRVVADVDRQSPANGFWRSMKMAVVEGERNKYAGKIDPLKVVFMRHAEQRLLIEHPTIPFDAELEVTTDARETAFQLGMQLRKSKVGHIYSSDSMRAIQTTEKLAEGMGTCSVSFHRELREFFPEQLEGRAMRDVRKCFGGDIFDRYRFSPRTLKIEDWESIDDASLRVVEFIKRICSTLEAENDRFVVSHRGLHAILVLTLLRGDLDRYFSIELDHLNISCFSKDRHGEGLALNCLNSKAIDSL